MIGKKIRLERIINRKNGRTVIAPMDHGVSSGPLRGIINIDETIESISQGGADAVLHPGAAGGRLSDRGGPAAGDRYPPGHPGAAGPGHRQRPGGGDPHPEKAVPGGAGGAGPHRNHSRIPGQALSKHPGDCQRGLFSHKRPVTGCTGTGKDCRKHP